MIRQSVGNTVVRPKWVIPKIVFHVERHGVVDVKDKRVGILISGGNVDLSRFAELMQGLGA